MKSWILIFGLFLSFGFAMAQDRPMVVPNYEKIEAEIKDSASKFFYPKQLERLKKYDTTLTVEELHYLYYGYVFHKNYNPYYISETEKKLNEYFSASAVDPKDYDKIISLGQLAIDEFPFDLRIMNFVNYIYSLKKDIAKNKVINNIFYNLLEVILSSGDGRTCESAFHVISISHEYAILNVFKFKFGGQALMGKCDMVTIEKDEREITEMYFDISRLLMISSKLFQKND